MRVKIDYGKDGLWIDVPDENLVKILKMKPSRPILTPTTHIAQALAAPIGSPPLAQLAQGKKTACIVICDITRPVPNKILLPPLLNTLEQNGIGRDRITILIATGIHRPNLGDELIQLVGPEIASNYRIVNHYARRNETHSYLGKTSRGTDVLVDSSYVNAELKITTGFIEPHLMAGFSGGRKLICPGISSLDTVKVMHSPKILEHPNAREGVIDGNPFHEESLEIAKMAGVDFIVNVALNEDKQIIGIFAGDLEKAHQRGVEFVREQVGDTVAEPVDIVITTSAGYPLDATFYQSIKGLTAALPIVKKGGTIILAAECREGLGSPEFSKLLRETEDVEVFMHNILKDDYFVVDQWQFEEYAKVLRKAEVYLFSAGISAEDKTKIFATPISSVEEGVKMALAKHGSSAAIAVIPKGPYILANCASI
ncbi:MAG: nickel-dependent lactate racemase [candidate division KSB1 bacterium]|nr:nickel-dependent lactate racemase [candidate division KSB1 bacterium]MDZ7335581.1 nickel-dependent lactate racemase [candidate division KSB1 bacterium]MDZ7356453.1 nickel-dependent lactate racemase [candidate division KSB1 bacterium]MDZ7401224.1 nickel-dependent lactate racemase [candidate division KSB1 bacterium]